MKMPLALKGLIILLIVAAIASMLTALLGRPNYLRVVSDFSLIATFITILFYVFYTYLLAKEAWTPSSKFELHQSPENKYVYIFLLFNHSKVPIRCWCNLNVTIRGKTIIADGFYGEKSSFDLQPYGGGTGILKLQDILAKDELTVDEAKRIALSYKPKEMLYMDIQFSYSTMDSTSKIKNPKQPHYFDFAREVLVADF
jgi:hypothetical protein